MVVTSRLGIPLEGRLFDGASPLLVFSAERANPAKHAILEAAGARVEQVPAGAYGLDIAAVLERLGELDVESVLVEGGGKLAASLIAANAVDQLEWFRAPIVLGDKGRAAIAGTTDDVSAAVAAWQAAGLDEVIIPDFTLGRGARKLDRMDAIIEHVAPQFR